jgi:long-subunit fatty acid transport protein
MMNKTVKTLQIANGVNMIKGRFYVLFLVFAGLGLLQGQSFSKTGMTAANFLSIEAGARANAMGGAFVSVANDASTLYWNAAGLENIDRNTVVFNHSNWLADISFDYLGVAIPLAGGAYGTFGASVTALGVPEMKVRTVDQPNGTGEMFDANDIAISVGYAKEIIDRFKVGVNFKYIHQQIYNMNATTAAVDFGVLFQTGFNDMSLGFSMTNFGGNLQLTGDDARVEVDLAEGESGNNDRILALLETQDFQLPLTLRFGLSMHAFKVEDHALLIATDAVVPNDNSQYVNVGAEYAFQNLAMLRIGYKTLFLEDSEEGLTFGAGINWQASDFIGLQVDYTYASFGRFSDVQQFALAIAF